MSVCHNATVRLALCCLAIATCAAVAATPAAAQSSLHYRCEVLVNGQLQGEADDVTATFDSALPENAVFMLGDDVSLSPLTSTVTSEVVADFLREADVEEVAGTGPVRVSVDGFPDLFFEAGLAFAATDVPETGPITLTPQGESPPIRPNEVGTYPLIIASFNLALGPAPETSPDYSALWCAIRIEDYTETPTPELAFDTFEVVGPATPTPTPTATIGPDTPRRPTLVQTDFADSTPSSSPVVGPIALAGAALCALLFIAAKVGGQKSRRNGRQD